MLHAVSFYDNYLYKKRSYKKQPVKANWALPGSNLSWWPCYLICSRWIVNKCFIMILKWLSALYAHINTKHFWKRSLYINRFFECWAAVTCINFLIVSQMRPIEIESHIWFTVSSKNYLYNMSECCQDSNFWDWDWLAEKFVHDYLRKSGFVCKLDSVVGGKHLQVWLEITNH